MKNLFIYTLLISTIVFSCNDDGHAPAKKPISNAFGYEESVYNLDAGYARYEDGIPGGGRLWTVVLVSSSITLEDELLTGTGNYVRLRLIAPSDEDALPEGKYLMDELADVQCLDGLFGINYAVDEEEGDTEIYLAEFNDDKMQVDVSKSGNTYTLEFAGTLADGNEKIYGKFSGEMAEL